VQALPAAALRCGLAAFLVAAAHAAEVSLDVGHTLAARGATSARGTSEFDFNRNLAQQLGDELRARGLAVREINFDGLVDTLAARPQQAAGSDVFLSLHHDSVHEDLLQEWDWDGTMRTYSDLHTGFSLFVSRNNPHLADSLRCASAIGASMRRAGFDAALHHATPLAGPARQPADASNAVFYYDRLVVLYRTTLPAVLFEAGVIKHREEELALLDTARQRRMVDAIATGIAACLSVDSAAAIPATARNEEAQPR